MRIDFSIISTIINIVFLITFILSMLFGFLKGFKKTLNCLISNLIVVVLAFSFCGLVAKALVNIDISSLTNDPSITTLSSAIENMLIQEFNIEASSMAATIDFAESAAVAIMRMPSYLLILIVGLIVIKPLLNLLWKSIIPLGSGKTIGFRFIGLALAFVSYIIVMFFFTAPIFGVYGMCNQVVSMTENDGEYKELNKGIVLGTATALFSENYTLQAEFTSKLIEIDTMYGKLNVKNELDNHEVLVKVLIENSENDDALIDGILDNYDAILQGFQNSEILDVFMPVILEVVKSQDTNSDINYDALIQADWDLEKQNIVNILKALCEFIDEVGLNLEDPKTMLGSEALPEAMKKIGEALENSGIVKDVLLVYINDLVQNAIKSENEDLTELANILDLTKLDLSNDFETLGHILNNLNSMDLFGNNEFNILNNIEVINSIIDNVFNLSTVNGNETTIIKTIINLASIDSMLAEMGIELNYDNINWKTEIQIIKKIFTDVLYLVKDSGCNDLADADILGILMDTANKEKTEEIIGNLAESQLISDSLIKVVSKIMTNLELDSWKSELMIAIENGETSTTTEWTKNELLKILDIYSKMDELVSLNFESMTDDELRNLKDTLLKINELDIISLDNIMSIINNCMVSASLDVRILDKIYDKDGSHEYNKNKNEWNEEIPRIIDIISNINNISFGSDTITNSTSVLADMLDKMKESHIFGNDVKHDGLESTDDNIFNQLIVEILTDNGLIKDGLNNGFIDQNEALNDDWSRYNYVNELSVLSQYDTSLDTQTDAVIGTLQSSEIIKKYFDIASVINDKINGVTFEIYGQTIILKDCINDGEPLTNDDLKDLDWTAEIEGMNEIIEAFDATDVNSFKVKIDEISVSENDSFAREAAIKIKALVGSFW